MWEGRGVPWPGRYLLRPQSMKTSAVCVAVGGGMQRGEDGVAAVLQRRPGLNNSYDLPPPIFPPPPFLFLCPLLLLLPLPLSTCPLLLSCWGWSPDPYTFYTNALLLEKLWKYILEGQGVYRDPEAVADLVGYCWAENSYGTVKEEESSSQGGGTDHVDLEDARSRWQR